jgi:hypothetical protein
MRRREDRAALSAAKDAVSRAGSRQHIDPIVALDFRGRNFAVQVIVQQRVPLPFGGSPKPPPPGVMMHRC